MLSVYQQPLDFFARWKTSKFKVMCPAANLERLMYTSPSVQEVQKQRENSVYSFLLRYCVEED